MVFDIGDRRDLKYQPICELSEDIQADDCDEIFPWHETDVYIVNIFPKK